MIGEQKGNDDTERELLRIMDEHCDVNLQECFEVHRDCRFGRYVGALWFFSGSQSIDYFLASLNKTVNTLPIESRFLAASGFRRNQFDAPISCAYVVLIELPQIWLEPP